MNEGYLIFSIYPNIHTHNENINIIKICAVGADTAAGPTDNKTNSCNRHISNNANYKTSSKKWQTKSPGQGI